MGDEGWVGVLVCWMCMQCMQCSSVVVVWEEMVLDYNDTSTHNTTVHAIPFYSTNTAHAF